MQAEQWNRVTIKQKGAKQDKEAYQIVSIIILRVSSAKLFADLIGQAQPFLDDRLRIYAPLSNMADDDFSWLKQTAVK